MIGDCNVLISSDDPPKVLKSGSDEVLAECEPGPSCPCCPQYANFPISGDITITASAELIPGWFRTWGNGETLAFVGTVDWTSPTPSQYIGGANTECDCTAEPNCDPFENCPENFGPYCVYDECVPPEPDFPFRYCSSLGVGINLACIADESFGGPGWYLWAGVGSADLCGGAFAFQTDLSGINPYPGFIKVGDDCAILPVGNWSIDLEGANGTVHVNLVIAEPTGACCQGYGDCQEVGESECGGTWYCAGTTCDENNFTTDAQSGACCYLGVCYDAFSRADCEITSGAVWMGACTDCAHETCAELPVMAEIHNYVEKSRPTHDWPLLLRPMKLLAKPSDKGLGDIVERTIGPVGGDAYKIWYKTTFGRDCGCTKRKDNLNKRYPL